MRKGAAIEQARRFLEETSVFREKVSDRLEAAAEELAALLESVSAEGERAGREEERARIIEVIGRSYGRKAEQIARVVTRVSEEARQFESRAGRTEGAARGRE
jgi:DNA repair ATPase RecN